MHLKKLESSFRLNSIGVIHDDEIVITEITCGYFDLN